MPLKILVSFSGDPILDLPPLIEYPWYDEESETQLFPFKTMTMLISLLCIILASWIAKMLFKKRVLPYSLDIFDCFTETYEISTLNASLNYELKSDMNGTSNPVYYLPDEKTKY